VDSGNKCFANAVLQLLVHCPPFWNLFKDRGKLIGQEGLGEGKWQETGGGATPLVDATIKFLDEFVYKETPSVMQQPQQKAGKGKSMEDEEEKEEHDTADLLELTYIYDVMKEKRQLNSLLVRTLSLQLLIHAGLLCTERPATGCSRVFRPLPRGAR
jgi:ubiquitin carboxyl-terminal hydrolase 10